MTQACVDRLKKSSNIMIEMQQHNNAETGGPVDVYLRCRIIYGQCEMKEVSENKLH